MANNNNRTLYEILELFFCTTTKARPFADNCFRNFDIKIIKAFIDLIDSYNNDVFQNILNAIPTDKEFLNQNYPSYFLWLDEEDYKGNYKEIISRKIFEEREKELVKLKNVLLEYVENENNPENHEEKYNGFFYKGDHRKLPTFYKFLVLQGYILCDYSTFSQIFKKQFIPSENRVLWDAPLSLLYYLISKIRKDKIRFESNYKYKKIIPLLFDYFDEKRERKPLESDIFTRNSNYNVIDTSKIDNALKELE